MTRITFLHPDLGIGGAERLVVDAALALKKNGHDVNFVTTHHDPDHCFSETRDGTIPVTVVGTWLPRHILGRFYAFCAYLRMVNGKEVGGEPAVTSMIKEIIRKMSRDFKKISIEKYLTYVWQLY